MTAHKHAALMAEYAKDALETDKPWERWEVCHHGSWFELNVNPSWRADEQYRRKRVPLCQVEGKDVFAGDKLWHTGEKMLMTVEDLANTRDSLHTAFYGTAYIKNLTWTKPAATKTVYQWAFKTTAGWAVSSHLYETEIKFRAAAYLGETVHVRRLDYTALEVPCDD